MGAEKINTPRASRAVLETQTHWAPTAKPDGTATRLWGWLCLFQTDAPVSQEKLIQEFIEFVCDY